MDSESRLRQTSICCTWQSFPFTRRLLESGGSKGRGPSLLIFKPIWCPKGRKKLFWETSSPPLCKGLDDQRPPPPHPPPPNLKVWIRHCCTSTQKYVVSRAFHRIEFVLTVWLRIPYFEKLTTCMWWNPLLHIKGGCCWISSFSTVFVHAIAPYRLGSSGLAQSDCCTRTQGR